MDIEFIRSSYCDGGSCVEAAYTDTPERCDNGYCVEVAFDDNGNTYVRNSREPNNIIAFTPDEWSAFLSGAQEGEFNFGLPIT